MNHSTQHTSDLLSAAIEQMRERKSLTLEELIGMLQGRGFGLVIVLFCIPNCLPIPNIAGLSAITGIPIIIIGLEMLIGRSHLWLPPVVSKKLLPAPKLAALLTRALPGIRKLEKLLHPRLLAASDPVSRRMLGLAFVLLATIMSLPIPFTNMLPGWAMALMAIGMIERDGMMILLGLGVGAMTAALIFALTDKAFALIQALLSHI